MDRGGSRMTEEYRQFLFKRLEADAVSRGAARRVMLSGFWMFSIRGAHDYIARRMRFPDYYGRNLDALYDVLSTIGQPTEVVITGREQIARRLGGYAEKLLEAFTGAAQANPNLRVEIR